MRMFVLVTALALWSSTAFAAPRCDVTVKADGNTAAIQRAMDRPSKRTNVVCLRPGIYRGARLIATRSCVLRKVGKGRAILDAGGRGRVMTVMADGIKVRLQGVTLTNGSSEQGGGVAVTHAAHVILEDTWVTANLASKWGGAVWQKAGKLELVRTRVSRNEAQLAGAIMIGPSAQALVASTLISDNKSRSGERDGPIVVSAGARVEVMSSSLVYNSGQGVYMIPAARGAVPASLQIESSIIMGTPDAVRVARREATRVSVFRSVLYGGIGFVALDMDSSRALPVFHLRDTERYRPTFGSPAIGIGRCVARTVSRDVAGTKRSRRCTAGAVESTREEIRKTLKARAQMKSKDTTQPWSYPAP